jgi:multimeric flavodoxin WrbA
MEVSYGICKDNLKCTYEDEAFEYLSRQILNCGALVLGTPVYWWVTSVFLLPVLKSGCCGIMDSLIEVIRVYEAGVKAFGDQA